MIKEIKQIGKPILRQKAKKVSRPNEPWIQEILSDMRDTLDHHRGAGLSAPQIGIPLRIFVVRLGDQIRSFINPELLAVSGESEEGIEACLSIPGFTGSVNRALLVKVKAINLKKSVRLGGFPARVFQHELDHLNGILIVDYEIKPN